MLNPSSLAKDDSKKTRIRHNLPLCGIIIPHNGRYLNTSFLNGKLFRLRLLCQVQLAHDPVKRVVGLVRADFAGGFLEAVGLTFGISHDYLP